MPNQTSTLPTAISMPQGGGAIKGIGETFQPDLFTGTANFSVPIPISAGRNGFEPHLRLQYSTGNGNGIFGMGWQLSLPNITRKTERGIPKYDNDDVFIISGAEDLVPHDDYASFALGNYSITRYRPRIDADFSR